MHSSTPGVLLAAKSEAAQSGVILHTPDRWQLPSRQLQIQRINLMRAHIPHRQDAPIRSNA